MDLIGVGESAGRDPDGLLSGAVMALQMSRVAFRRLAATRGGAEPGEQF